MKFCASSSVLLAIFELIPTIDRYARYNGYKTNWADPFISHASQLMHQIAEDIEECKKIGGNAGNAINSYFDNLVVKRVKNALVEKIAGSASKSFCGPLNWFMDRVQRKFAKVCPMNWMSIEVLPGCGLHLVPKIKGCITDVVLLPNPRRSVMHFCTRKFIITDILKVMTPPHLRIPIAA